MKVKPVMDALEERGAKVILVHTGQHYDPAMNDVFFAELGIRRPDHFLGAGSGTHAVQTCRAMTAFEQVAAGLAPDMVVVAGDVNSTLACALAAAKLRMPLAHVEAGLRSRDRSMPEEINTAPSGRSPSPRAPTGWSGGTQTGSSRRRARCWPRRRLRHSGRPCGTARPAGG